MPEPAHPDRRFLVAVDMERYSRQDNPRQHASQTIFREVMREAATLAGLDDVNWVTQRSGDGELAILPAGTPEPMVVSGLVPAIDRLLRERNRSLVPEAKVRLRVALHQGLVHLDGANGFPGEAVVTVSRLCDAEPLKQALARFPDASVGLIVSRAVFEDIVRHRYAGLRPERFLEVRVDMPGKGFSDVAHIHVPDEDVAGSPTEARAESSTAAGSTGHTPARTAPTGDTFSFPGGVTHTGPTAYGTGSNAISYGSDGRR